MPPKPQQIEAAALEYDGDIYPASEASATDSYCQPNDEEQSLFVRVLKAGKSANTVTGYEYPARVVEDAVPMFDNCHVYRNHLSEQEYARVGGIRDVADKVGILRQARYNPTNQAAEARLYVFDTNEYNKLKRGRDAYGISFFGRVAAPPPNVKPRVVTRLAEVRSVDIVDRPGGGGYISPAFESQLKEILMPPNETPTPEQPQTQPQQGASIEDVLKAITGLSVRLDKLETPSTTTTTTPEAPAAEAALQVKLRDAEFELANLKQQAAINRLATAVNGKTKLPPALLQLATDSFSTTATDDVAIQTAMEAHFTRYAGALPQAASASPQRPSVTGNGESQPAAESAARTYVTAIVPRVGDDLADFRNRMGWTNTSPKNKEDN